MVPTSSNTLADSYRHRSPHYSFTSIPAPHVDRAFTILLPSSQSQSRHSSSPSPSAATIPYHQHQHHLISQTPQPLLTTTTSNTTIATSHHPNSSQQSLPSPPPPTPPTPSPPSQPSSFDSTLGAEEITKKICELYSILGPEYQNTVFSPSELHELIKSKNQVVNLETKIASIKSKRIEIKSSILKLQEEDRELELVENGYNNDKHCIGQKIELLHNINKQRMKTGGLSPPDSHDDDSNKSVSRNDCDSTQSLSSSIQLPPPVDHSSIPETHHLPDMNQDYQNRSQPGTLSTSTTTNHENETETDTMNEENYKQSRQRKRSSTSSFHNITPSKLHKHAQPSSSEKKSGKAIIPPKIRIPKVLSILKNNQQTGMTKAEIAEKYKEQYQEDYVKWLQLGYHTTTEMIGNDDMVADNGPNETNAAEISISKKSQQSGVNFKWINFVCSRLEEKASEFIENNWKLVKSLNTRNVFVFALECSSSSSDS